ncbi:DUF4974 domain-containing protein [Sphingobium amiense]|uniref:DUF4974 domain-containing protein n=1 Tax=Sphingobium amiense TaxID=135719 RepID=A0A494VX82_9SPHN|nr:FecR domain-containing protein [Sphingobium amiense]BBD97014.1 DUF4974 domain-containing protein [Sphingobium amiense]
MSAERPCAGIDAEVAEWLVAHDRGLNADEDARFREWIADSVANREGWARGQAMWADFDRAPDPLLSSIRDEARSLGRPVWRSLSFQGVAVAASIILCISFLLWGQIGTIAPNNGPNITAAPQVTRYSSDTQRREVMLPDGSRVMLDARSKISFAQVGSRREVALLDGQAYFQVAHDVTRPFVVSTEGHTVTATGTAFGVSLIASRLSVVLEEGSVVVSSLANGTSHALSPGQAFTVSASGEEKVASADVDTALAWRSGYLELHNMTIAEAVERMNHYVERPVTVGDAQAGALRVSGQFRTDDPGRFVDTIAELYPVRVRRNARGGLEIVSSRNRGV